MARSLRHALQRDRNLVIDIKVTPRARTQGISCPLADGILKVSVNAAPEDGRANDAVCDLLAAYLNVPKRNVDVILGHASRRKRVRISL